MAENCSYRVDRVTQLYVAGFLFGICMIGVVVLTVLLIPIPVLLATSTMGFFTWLTTIGLGVYQSQNGTANNTGTKPSSNPGNDITKPSK